MFTPLPPPALCGSKFELIINETLFYERQVVNVTSGKSYERGRLSTIDLLVLTRLDQIYIKDII
jgi:hypothetical protein